MLKINSIFSSVRFATTSSRLISRLKKGKWTRYTYSIACSCNGLSCVLRSAGALVDACFLSKFDRTGIRLAGDEEDNDGVEWTDALGELSCGIVIGLQGVVHVIIVDTCVQSEL